MSSPALAEALRTEIRAALEADGQPFTVNVAHRVYDLAIASKDLLVATTKTVEDAVNLIADNNGPMDGLMAPSNSPAPLIAAESFGARMMREILAVLPTIMQRPQQEDPIALVHALAEARGHGLTDVALKLERRLFGNELFPAATPTPSAATSSGEDESASVTEIEVALDSFENGFNDGIAGRRPASTASSYQDGYRSGVLYDVDKLLSTKNDEPMCRCGADEDLHTMMQHAPDCPRVRVGPPRRFTQAAETVGGNFRLVEYVPVGDPPRSPEVPVECPKCGHTSGDDWRQCGDSCPMPMSPHYKGLPL